MVIEPRFGIAYDFGDGLAPVSYEAHPAGKYGFIDHEGKMVIEPQFKFAGSFSEGLAPVIF